MAERNAVRPATWPETGKIRVRINRARCDSVFSVAPSSENPAGNGVRMRSIVSPDSVRQRSNALEVTSAEKP